jgi:hypothetical protein
MHMGMAGLVTIDRDPIDLRAKIGLNLAHQVAGVCGQVDPVRAVFGLDDEPELVAIIRDALHKDVTIGAILGRGINLAALAVARSAIALDIRRWAANLPFLPAFWTMTRRIPGAL